MTENAGRKETYEVAGHEIAGREKNGRNCRHEIAGHENVRRVKAIHARQILLL